MFVLLDAPLKDIKKVAGPIIAEAVKRMRKGQVNIASGYDGEFGTIQIFSDEERKQNNASLAMAGV